MCVACYLIVGLTFLSLMTSAVEHLFMWLLAIFYLLGEKSIQAPCPFFN